MIIIWHYSINNNSSNFYFLSILMVATFLDELTGSLNKIWNMAFDKRTLYFNINIFSTKYIVTCII